MLGNDVSPWDRVYIAKRRLTIEVSVRRALRRRLALARCVPRPNLCLDLLALPPPTVPLTGMLPELSLLLLQWEVVC